MIQHQSNLLNVSGIFGFTRKNIFCCLQLTEVERVNTILAVILNVYSIDHHPVEETHIPYHKKNIKSFLCFLLTVISETECCVLMSSNSQSEEYEEFLN